jgi:hypothetical protein
VERDSGRLGQSLRQAEQEPPSVPSERRRVQLQLVQAQFEAIARGDVALAFENASADLTLEVFAPPEFSRSLKN